MAQPLANCRLTYCNCSTYAAPPFRDHLIAASLKLAARGFDIVRCLPFRDHLIAASLKRQSHRALTGAGLLSVII